VKARTLARMLRRRPHPEVIRALAKVRRVGGYVPPGLGPEDVLVFCSVQDAADQIEGFLDHHLALGVRGVVMLDQGSRDETVQLALRRAPVLVLHSPDPITNPETVRAILEPRFLGDARALWLNVEQRFSFLGQDRISLGRLCRFLAREGRPGPLAVEASSLAGPRYAAYCDAEARDRKVFCVGFHKTGTTSMGTLFRALGYRAISNHRTRDRGFVQALSEGRLDALMHIARLANAFEDNPWPLFYEQWDRAFPGSRFILTTRDPSAWSRSVVNHFGAQAEPDSAMRRLIYGDLAGDPKGHEALYRARMHAHNEAVRAYFCSRSADLLEVDVSEPDALTRICEFLGHKTELQRMPHANRRLT